MSLKIALRNLFRNKRRSALTASAVAMATGLLVWTTCMMEGMVDMMVDAAVGVQLGQLQVHSADYVDDPIIYNAFPWDAADGDALRADPAIEAAAPRVVVFGLIGTEKRGRVVRMVGVDAAQEAAVAGLDTRIADGTWLTSHPPPYPAPREVVLGKIIANQLGVAIGDELVLRFQRADGSPAGDEVLRVVGTVVTANSLIDRMGAYMHLADLQYAAALDGRVHEVTLTTSHGADLDAARDTVQRILASRGEPGDPKLVTRTWMEIVPEFHQLVELSRSSMWIYYLFIYFIAALAILNTQRMSAWERRREFGVLLAIGLRPWRLGRQVIAEAVFLTFGGGLVGALGGWAASYYHATEGFDMSGMTDSGAGFSYMGVTFGQTLFFHVTAEAVVSPLVVIVIVGLLCGLWPGIKSARLDVVRAIAGRT